MAAASPLAPLPLRVHPHEVPDELADNPIVRFLATMTPEQELACEALLEAGARYGDDADRELADLEAGRHPLQRRRT